MLIPRLSDDERAALQAAQEHRAFHLLRGARGLRGLTPEQVRRIASRLDAPVAPVAPIALARRRPLVTALVALALLLSAGTALALVTGTFRRLSGVGALVGPRPAVPREAPPSRPAARPSLPSNEAVAPGVSASATGDELDPATAAAPAAPPVRHQPSLSAGAARSARGEPAGPGHDGRDRVPARPSSVSLARPEAAAVPESPIAREGESFANVLRRWRQDHDGPAALAALDLHDRSFAGGQMTLEARLLRVEIFLAGGRDRDALAVLDGLQIGATVPRRRELLTARGELRIKAGRCEEGRADLAAISGGADALGERARNALTHCR